MTKHKEVTDDNYEQALKLLLKATLLIAPTRSSENEFKQLVKFARYGGWSAEITTKQLISKLHSKLTTGVWF
jgi:hypothetical protein